MRASYREYPPCPALQPYVQCYWSREARSAAPGAALNRVLPDGCMDIVFSFGDRWTGSTGRKMRDGRPGGVAVGTMTLPLLVHPGHREEFFGIRFRPGRAPAFLGLPASECTDDAIPLAETWGREGAALEQRLAEACGPQARVALMEGELQRRLARAAPPDCYVDAVVGLMARHYGVVSVARACEYAGITRQHLARRFERHVGIPPKLFSRVIRFQSLLKRVERANPVSWSSLAADAGYYDQAHLIADFRQFTGLTPEAFLQQSRI